MTERLRRRSKLIERIQSIVKETRATARGWEGITFADLNANDKVDLTNSTTDNEIIQENHYYAFGMTHEGPWLMNHSTKDNFYQYNGKEFNNDHALNWNDYGARWYDPAVGRFTSIDELSDAPNNISLSPYHYVANNPIVNIDPDGLDWYRNDENGETYWIEGNEDVKGHTNLGAYFIVEGKTGYVLHYQNEVIATASKDEADKDQAYDCLSDCGSEHNLANQITMMASGLFDGPMEMVYPETYFMPLPKMGLAMNVSAKLGLAAEKSGENLLKTLWKRQMSAKDVKKVLIKLGYKFNRQEGSHETWKKDGKSVQVPNHGSKSIPIGTLQKIKKDIIENAKGGE